jgi:hypothetical protein
MPSADDLMKRSSGRDDEPRNEDAYENDEAIGETHDRL